jgi:hypothetical protein
MAASTSGYYHHLNFRCIEDFDDEALANEMRNVTGVNMLDLNETDITNESIKLLTHLAYVNELRAKECQYLDNGCISDLNKLTSLTFLHVNSTAITIDGLLQLNNLQQLKTLLFSADDVAGIKEKLLQLKLLLPQCEIIINSKPYSCNAIDLFIYAIKKYPVTYRLKIKNEPVVPAWSDWLIQPTDSYIEAAAQGPYAVDAIEWLEINPIETRTEGKIIPANEIDHTEAIIKLLEWLWFPYVIKDGIISLYLLQRKV